jgi:primosomal protein N'
MSRVARVLPDVTGLDKSFDYWIPDDLVDHIVVGTIVRVELHGRRIGGWVTQIVDESSVGDLKPIAKVTGHGPAAELIELNGPMFAGPPGESVRFWLLPRRRRRYAHSHCRTDVHRIPRRRRLQHRNC